MLKKYMAQSSGQAIRYMCTMSGNMENYVKNGKKIIGVAANYKELLKQMNREVPKAPGLFIKPTTSYIVEPQKIVIPKDFKVNEEIELGIVIGKTGKNISKSQAMDYVGGYCIALDMTATCQMDLVRSTGGSWTLGKGFDTACPVSKFIPKNLIPDPHNVQLWCQVNGKEVQNGNTNDLAFDIPTLIEYISKYFTLEPNDIIITGSPPGMGPVYKGDVIEGGIQGIPISTIRFEVDAE